ncbi:MAG: hypothetical protein LBV04_04450 [Deferribacteraceae bacterium]|jgi:hypothetical protein|nr:hypothetical protein [Deferribacteraceae bacterium]
MKKITICLLLVLSCFVLSACSDGGGGGGGNGVNLDTMNVTISGTYDDNSGNSGKFTASTGPATASIAATPMAAGDYLLSGKLESGAIIFNLTGTYNSETKTYILSAASNSVVYLRIQIAGELNDNGAATSAEVTLATSNDNGATWTSTTIPADDMGTQQTPTGTPDTNAVEGLPAKWLGQWRGTDAEGYPFYLAVSPFKVDMVYYTQDNWTVKMDAVTVTGSGNEYILTTFEKNGSDEYYARYKVVENSATQNTVYMYGNDSDGWEFASIGQIVATTDSGTKIYR